jgi:DMATS type aromatic prenyltransferase
MGLKAYFLPQLRSQLTGVPVTDILTSTIDSLGMALPWSKVTSHISTLPAEFDVKPVIAAVDCVSDADNRFKVYVRTQATHLSALRDMITLGGQLQGPAVDATLAQLQKLWHASFRPNLGRHPGQPQAIERRSDRFPVLLRDGHRQPFAHPKNLHPRRSLPGQRRPCSSGDVTVRREQLLR